MRILHIVTGLAPDGRFGGITRVALDLCKEQMARGDDARILTTDIGLRAGPSRLEGVPVLALRARHLVPRLGFAAVFAPGVLAVLDKRIGGADVVHVHLARDAFSLPAAWLLSWTHSPLVLQTHGMIDAPRNALAPVVDALMTRRVFQRAQRVLSLSTDEVTEADRLSSGRTPATLFANGISPIEEEIEGTRPPTTFLFLARLHPRKGALEFTRSAIDLSTRLPQIRFVIIGPDEGDAQAVDELILHSKTTGNVSRRAGLGHQDAMRAMGEAALYVLPARHEPFGLTIIEAMTRSVPVIVHETAALAPSILRGGAGWVFGPNSSFTTLTAAMEHVATNEGARVAAGKRARTLADASFSLRSVVDELYEAYAATTRTQRLIR